MKIQVYKCSKCNRYHTLGTKVADFHFGHCQGGLKEAVVRNPFKCAHCGLVLMGSKPLPICPVCNKPFVDAWACYNQKNNPIRKVKGGWRWGRHGHVYPNREGAVRQMRAAFAAGYSENPVGGAEKLYQDFHGNPPAETVKVYYEPPTQPLVKIGDLSEIKYRPTGPSSHVGTEFFHKSGDTGEQMLKTNLILCTDSKGKNIYLVKKSKSKYPVFTNRGIIG